MATEATYGSAGYNTRRLLNKIRQEKQVSDAVIVIFHGGNEFNPLPSPDTQNRYRLICDMGADAVIAGHTHCPQGFEMYEGKPIIYSMGNFLFKSSSERSANDSWHYGYMTELDIDESGIVFCTIPYKFNSEATRITVFEGDEKRKMLRYIDSLSEIIKDPQLLDNYFSGWAYLHKWVPQAPSNYFDLKEYNSSGNYNLISCESHLSQAKKVLEFCFLDRVAEAKEWSEKVAELTRMPV
jgi:poly-gamma-glutamate synthesis protein (capsule biosynthesis protein)